MAKAFGLHIEAENQRAQNPSQRYLKFPEIKIKSTIKIKTGAEKYDTFSSISAR